MAKGLEKVNLHPNSKKGSTKDYTHHQTIALICHASKVMLKIWHARLQHYGNQKLSDAQLGFRKGRATRDQTANILWIIGRARGVPEKTSTSVSWTTLKSLTVWIITTCGKLLKRWEYQTVLPVSWETCMQVKKQQLEPCIEPLICSRLRKEYNRAVCCQPVCLTTYTLTTSWRRPDWMNYKLESKSWEKYQQHHICRGYHSNGRQWRGTKEPLDESEGGDWKSWLKTKYHKN